MEQILIAVNINGREGIQSANFNILAVNLLLKRQDNIDQYLQQIEPLEVQL